MKRNMLIAGLACVAAVLYLGNASFPVAPRGTRPLLLAHRGLAQPYDRTGLTNETCTAARMLPADHTYLENTIPSMEAAFALGADVVEFDVHRTSDDQFAVFHDWTLDCRTDGTGVTREQTLADLQTLDIGYGYTGDGGATYPFRGQGIALMPSLEEVLTAFPDRDFLIDVKSNDASEGELLAAHLAPLLAARTGTVMVYGGAAPVNTVRARLPAVRTLTRPQLQRCLIRYIAWGWSGHVPDACTRSVLMVPHNVAPWLWGWPNRFLQRMDGANSAVFLVGDYNGEGFSTSFDDVDQLQRLPADYSGGIWTDRIDLVAPASQAKWPSPH